LWLPAKLLIALSKRTSTAHKDYKDKHRLKIMELSAHDFIQRFLWHILPDGFHRIRYYGFLSNGRRKANIELIRQLIAESSSSQQPLPDEETLQPLPPLKSFCPACGAEGFSMTLTERNLEVVAFMLELLPWRATQGGGL